ncbi:hypothetical protein GCM10007421_28270 [Halopseudomonas oceani]|nr:hypothetical protein GCM10007421_28270 [Halopseudomonas oceani]
MQVYQLAQQACIQIQRDGQIRLSRTGLAYACPGGDVAADQHYFTCIEALAPVADIDLLATLQHQAQKGLDYCVIHFRRRYSPQQDQAGYRGFNRGAFCSVLLAVAACGLNQRFVHVGILRLRMGEGKAGGIFRQVSWCFAHLMI